MDERIVAADASPLITLASIGAFNLLRELFGRIVVTTAVRNEVLAGGTRPGVQHLNDAVEEGWAIIVETEPANAPYRRRGAGEASVLALAQGHSGPSLLLMDDPLARSQARALGKPNTGVVGILLMAKRQGLIPEVGSLLRRLKAGGFRLSDQVVGDALAEAGESGRDL